MPTTGNALDNGTPQDHITPRPLPARPTLAGPGTSAKVEVMRERWARGEHLHHPDDATSLQPGEVVDVGEVEDADQGGAGRHRRRRRFGAPRGRRVYRMPGATRPVAVREDVGER